MAGQHFGFRVLLGSADYPGYLVCLALLLRMRPLYGFDDFADLSIWTLGPLHLALDDLVADWPTPPTPQVVLKLQ